TTSGKAGSSSGPRRNTSASFRRVRRFARVKGCARPSSGFARATLARLRPRAASATSAAKASARPPDRSPFRRRSTTLCGRAPRIFEVRGLPAKAGATGTGADPRENADSAGMDKYRGVNIGNVIDCEGGSLIVKTYTSATAVDRDGNVLKEFKGNDRHMQNFI